MHDKNMRHFALVVLLLLGVIGSSIAGVIIHLRNNTDVVLDGVQVIYEGKQRLHNKFRVTDVFCFFFFKTGSDQMAILSSPFTGELGSLDGNIDLTGKIVVIPSLLFTSNLPLVRHAQELGAAAVLATLYYHSKLYFTFTKNKKKPDIFHSQTPQEWVAITLTFAMSVY
jgi:hypothetical protein